MILNDLDWEKVYVSDFQLQHVRLIDSSLFAHIIWWSRIVNKIVIMNSNDPGMITSERFEEWQRVEALGTAEQAICA